MYEKREYKRKKPLVKSQRKLTKENIRWLLLNAITLKRTDMALSLNCSKKTLDRILAGESYKDWVKEIKNENNNKINNSFDVVG